VNIEYSICIVSHNRKNDLHDNLIRLLAVFKSGSEIIVGLDGCTDDSISLKCLFPEVIFVEFNQRLWPSVARRHVMALAKGQYIFGFDDDSYPVNKDITSKIINYFNQNPQVGILAFRLFNGLDLPDNDVLFNGDVNPYMCSEFPAGACVFRKNVYETTGGYPIWMTIYGEESYVSMRCYELGYCIHYFPEILVHHKTDVSIKINSNYPEFRLENQVRNGLLIILLTYPFPNFIFLSLKLFWHNVLKYAIKSRRKFIAIMRGIGSATYLLIFHRFREKRISKATFKNLRNLPLPFYNWKPPER
jgi:GT2 family glycosyltransferase